MFKQLKENLNNIFGSKEPIISKTYCKCGSVIKCNICKTKKTLKDLIDETDPSHVKIEIKIQCKHILPKHCKKCLSKLQISKVFRQSLNQQNVILSQKQSKNSLKKQKQNSVQNEQRSIQQMNKKQITTQNYMISLKLQKPEEQNLNHEEIVVIIPE